MPSGYAGTGYWDWVAGEEGLHIAHCTLHTVQIDTFPGAFFAPRTVQCAALCTLHPLCTHCTLAGMHSPLCTRCTLYYISFHHLVLPCAACKTITLGWPTGRK